MKNVIYIIIIFSLLFTPCFQAFAQANQGDSIPGIFDTSDFPQWAKDMRRFDIVAFGSFPFSLFLVTFATDMFRWNNANGMDFSEQGRQYAPWPLKSAGAVGMTSGEIQRTLWLSVGLSVVVALVDLIIVKIRDDSERRRTESQPSGSVIIDRRPIEEDE